MSISFVCVKVTVSCDKAIVPCDKATVAKTKVVEVNHNNSLLQQLSLVKYEQVANNVTKIHCQILK